MNWTLDELAPRGDIAYICAKSRYGTVEGVEIDLRHPLLDPQEWLMPLMGTDLPPYTRWVDRLFLWFPWFGEFDKSKIKQCAKEARDEDVASAITSKPRALRDYIKERTSDHVLKGGDRIEIDYVERYFVREIYEHPHDREVRFAGLRLVRNGRSTYIKQPILFNGSKAVLVANLSRETFDIIVNRICEYFKVDNLWKIRIDDDNGAGCAVRLAQTIEALIHNLREDLRSHDDRKRDAASDMLWRVSSAVQLGYFWAKAEEQLSVAPFALSALRAKAGAAAGGSKTGKARLQKRIDGWEPIAKQMAKDIRAAKPWASQDDVATDIAHGWKARNHSAPGHSTLKELISLMEKAGELPPRQRRQPAKGLRLVK